MNQDLEERFNIINVTTEEGVRACTIFHVTARGYKEAAGGVRSATSPPNVTILTFYIGSYV